MAREPGGCRGRVVPRARPRDRSGDRAIVRGLARPRSVGQPRRARAGRLPRRRAREPARRAGDLRARRRPAAVPLGALAHGARRSRGRRAREHDEVPAAGRARGRCARRLELEAWLDLLQPGWRDVLVDAALPARDGRDATRSSPPRAGERQAARARACPTPRVCSSWATGWPTKACSSTRRWRARSGPRRELGMQLAVANVALSGTTMAAMPTTSAPSPVAEPSGSTEQLLWGLAYRMTGSAADADDVVQDTFERATAHPPARLDEPLRPWLVRVAMNVARDSLRRRKRRAYVGPWLPSPVETAARSQPTPRRVRGGRPLRATRVGLVRLPRRARGAHAAAARRAAASRRARLLRARDRRGALALRAQREDDAPPRSPCDGRLRRDAQARDRRRSRTPRGRRSSASSRAIVSEDRAGSRGLPRRGRSPD